MKRVLSLILIIVLILGSTGIEVYAQTNPPTYPKLGSQSLVDSLKDEIINAGKELENEFGKPINVALYQIYGMYVYGEPHGDEKYPLDNGIFEFGDEKGEYRYLGYSYENDKITNHMYPHNPSGLPGFGEREYRRVKSLVPWRDLSPWQQNIIFTEDFYDDDTGNSYNMAEVFAYMEDVAADTELMKPYINVQSAPYLFIGNCSLYFRYIFRPGSDRYDTIVRMPDPVSITCTVDADDAEIKSYEDEIEIDVTVTGGIDASVNANLIDSVILSIGGQTQTVPKDNPSHTFAVTISRNDFDPGNNTEELKATCTYISTLDRVNDKKTVTGTKNINVDVEAKGQTYADCDLTLDPSYVKYQDGDVTVNATIDGKIYGVADPDEITGVIYRIKKGSQSFAEYTMPIAIEGTKEVVFTIPAGDITGSQYTEKFEAEVEYDLGGNIMTGSDKANVLIDDTPPPPPPPPDNNPPQVFMSAPGSVKAGEDFYVSASSTDLDDDTVTHSWNKGVANGSVSGSGGTLWYSSTYSDSSRTISVTGNDGNGGTDTESQAIYIYSPTVDGIMSISGTLKENRKITITNDSETPSHYPLNTSNFTITALSGGSSGDIKYSGNLTGTYSKDILFKKAGTYRISLYTANTAGYNDTVTEDIIIVEDKPPVADFETVTAYTRDPDDNNNATIKTSDKSYSPDNDNIASRDWYIRYDSDNDGNITEHSFSLFNTGNNKEVTVKRNEVGNYEIKLEVKEGFGQSTLTGFVSDGDYKSDDTEDKPDNEKKLEIYNVAPIVGYTATLQRKIDLKFVVDGYTESDVISNMPTIIANMASNGYVVNDYDVLTLSHPDNNNPYYQDVYYIDDSKLYKYSISNNSHQYIKDFGGTINAACITPNGDVYYNNSCDIYRYSLTNGSTTKIFNVSSGSGWVWRIKYSKEGYVYFANRDYTLYRYNTSTGLIQLMYQHNENRVYFDIDKEGGVYYLGRTRYGYRDLVRVKNGTTKTIAFGFGTYGVDIGMGNIVYSAKNSNPSLNSFNIETGEVKYRGMPYGGSYGFGVGLSDNNLFVQGYESSSSYKRLGVKNLNTGSYKSVGSSYDGWYCPSTTQRAVFADGNAYTIFNFYYSWISRLTRISPSGKTYIKTLDWGGMIVAPPTPYDKISISELFTDDDYAFSNDSTDRYVVLLTNNDIADFNDNTKKSNFKKNLLDNNLDLLLVTNNAVKNNNLDLLFDENKYISNSGSLTSVFGSISSEIENAVEDKTSMVGDYYIVDKEYIQPLLYSDYESDPENDMRVRYIHEPNYFDNNTGSISDNGVFRNTMYNSFSKVGKYTMSPQKKDNPKNVSSFDIYKLWSNSKPIEFYVHRLPFADFLLVATPSGGNYNLSYTSLAYDQDHMSRADKGILASRWYYKEIDDTEWTEGQLVSIPANLVYLIKHDVMDMEFAWSSKVQTIDTSSTNTPPTAVLIFDSPHSIYDTLIYTDNSFDPNGDSITAREFEIYNSSDTLVYSGSSMNTDFSGYSLGDYTVKLRVKDASDWSAWTEKPLEIVGDNTPPTASVTPGSRGIGKTNVGLTFTGADTGGSGYKGMYYLFTEDIDSINEEFSFTTSSSFTRNITTDGEWYVIYYSEDNDGNISDLKTAGSYIIDKTVPDLESVSVLDFDYYSSEAVNYDNFGLYENVYWIKDNTTARIAAKTYEEVSLYRNYLRLYGNNNDNRAYHSWSSSSTHLSEYSTSTLTDIESVAETKEDNGDYELEFTVRGQANKTNISQIYIYCRDTAINNSGWIGSGVYFGVDSIEPTLTVTPEQSDWTDNNISIGLKLEDGHSGVDNIKYAWSSSTSKPHPDGLL
jgi:hypothetical protein